MKENGSISCSSSDEDGVDAVFIGVVSAVKQQLSSTDERLIVAAAAASSSRGHYVISSSSDPVVYNLYLQQEFYSNAKFQNTSYFKTLGSLAYNCHTVVLRCYTWSRAVTLTVSTAVIILVWQFKLQIIRRVGLLVYTL